MKKLLIALPLLAIAFILGRCAGDLTGEAGPAGSDALSSPTLTIRGGGKISWAPDTTNPDLFEVSFTEDLIIYDHQAGSTITITPSASPITLASQDDVGYVARVTAAGSETTLTRIDVAALDTVSAGDSSETALVLFHRTDEDTLWLPWVQKELLTGDFWQFGVALSWYERIISNGKPRYYTSTVGTTVTFPATTSNPAILSIDGKLYSNSQRRDCDLADSSTCTLDKDTFLDSNSTYYLYGIPSNSSRNFELVVSSKNPDTGPTDHASWSYIGALATDHETPVIVPFQASNGVLLSNEEIAIVIVNAGEPRTKVIFESMPATVLSAYFQLYTDADSAGAGQVVSLRGTNSNEDALSARVSVDGTNVPAHGWVPIFTQQTVWATPGADTNCSVQFQGWQESPMAYK